jgi:hypothetical protein
MATLRGRDHHSVQKYLLSYRGLEEMMAERGSVDRSRHRSALGAYLLLHHFFCLFVYDPDHRQFRIAIQHEANFVVAETRNRIQELDAPSSTQRPAPIRAS